ncbi:NAD-dependent epimerase/dehydratase family protein [Pseudomonas sp. Marseille-QA0892]
MKVLVTGGTGFVGRALVRALSERDIDCLLAARKPISPASHPVFLFEGLDRPTDWTGALAGTDAVIHSAARVHLAGDGPGAADAHRRINTEATLELARQAAVAGVQRFVFVSTVKVMGESSRPGRPFTYDDIPMPVGAYATSKRDAEVGLRAIEAETGMDVVIVRPPLVYGPGVRANFLQMYRWVNAGIPLPLAAIDNQRSLLALDNLVDLLVRCLLEPKAAGQTFLACDGQDLSTADLIEKLAAACGKRARLFSMPEGLARLAGSLLGKREAIRRLYESLQLDDGHTRSVLSWNPPISVDEALEKVVRDLRVNS